MFSLTVPAFASEPSAFIEGEIIAQSADKKTFYVGFQGVKDAKGKTEFSGNNSIYALPDGITLVSDNKTKGAEAWYLNVPEGLNGTIQVAYKISNQYFIVEFAIEGAGKYLIGTGNAVNMCKVGAFIACTDDEDSVVEERIVVNLGFIGYYLFDDVVMSTSIHWQALNEGDFIDWDAVDAAYADWVAEGGLEPDRTLWQTSGYASYTFEDYAAIGFGDFTEGQIEGYYLNYYVDPGYILPGGGDTNTASVTLCFYAYLDGSWWTGLNYFETHDLGIEITPNWDAVYEAYATQANVTPGWMEEARVTGWQSSGALSVYLEGSRPSLTLTEGMLDQLMLAGDTHIITLEPVLASAPLPPDPDPDPVDPDPVDPEFASAKITSYTQNLQNGNNENLRFVVTITLTDGSTLTVNHAESVNGQQSGSAVFDYGNYQVRAQWNDNNWVTSLSIIS